MTYIKKNSIQRELQANKADGQSGGWDAERDLGFSETVNQFDKAGTEIKYQGLEVSR